MSKDDIRWNQFFNNYCKALEQLSQAVELYEQRPLSDIEKLGFVKIFELTHELAWNVMKDFFIYQSSTQIMGPRDATRESFQKKLITDGESWMEMIKTRNKAVHTYDEVTVNEVISITVTKYYPLFISFQATMQKLQND